MVDGGFLVSENLIDVSGGLARVGGNEGLYKRLLEKFKTSIDMPEFDRAVAAKDYLKAGELVHAAKGVGGNLSLTAFFEQASTLMDQLRGGGAPQDLDVQLFKARFDETVAAIDEYLS
jgi:HPt (histidine-containing phosphotransfer) domain-containing protein